jgi:hypothetical protein
MIVLHGLCRVGFFGVECHRLMTAQKENEYIARVYSNAAGLGL